MMTFTSIAQNNSNSTSPANTKSLDLIGFIANMALIRTIAAMYSGLMEEEITPRFTLHLINVQVAGFFTIMPAELLSFARILCLLWLVCSVCLAKRAYHNQ